MMLIEDKTDQLEAMLAEELIQGYTSYTDAPEINLAIHRGDSELIGSLTGISLTVTISTLITGCG